MIISITIKICNVHNLISYVFRLRSLVLWLGRECENTRIGMIMCLLVPIKTCNVPITLNMFRHHRTVAVVEMKRGIIENMG